MICLWTFFGCIGHEAVNGRKAVERWTGNETERSGCDCKGTAHYVSRGTEESPVMVTRSRLPYATSPTRSRNAFCWSYCVCSCYNWNCETTTYWSWL